MDPVSAATRTAELAATHGVVGVLCLIVVGLSAVVAVLWREVGKSRQALSVAQAEHYRQMVAELERKAEVERVLVSAVASIREFIEHYVGSGHAA